MIAPVIDAAAFLERRTEFVCADVRWYLDGRSGQKAYASGHIPGAVFVDLDAALAGPTGPGTGRHPLPDPERFAAAMAAAGIGEGSVVVAYDDAGGLIAARLVWMLRVIGHGAAVLDGGLAAWPGPLEAGVTAPGGATFTARPWPKDRLAELADAASPDNVVLDARSPERYRGEEEPVDARAGHIPGARNLPCAGNLDAAGRFLPADELRRRFLGAGATVDGAPVVSYCGSGVTACHNLLALELAGLPPGRLYAGSWSQYASLADLPVETGEGAAGGSS